jgi:hypothetical protein
MTYVSPVVRPETETLTLSNGDRLVVARRLTAGQELDAVDRQWRFNPSTGRPEMLMSQMTIAKMVAYLVNWSVKDAQENVIPIYEQPPDVVEAGLRRLTGEMFREIRDAIDAHDVRVAEQITAEKKTRSGSLESSPSTASVALPAGPGGTSAPSPVTSTT